jgi:hypothetical protein
MCLNYFNLKTLKFDVVQTKSENLVDFYFYKNFNKGINDLKKIRQNKK